MKKISDYNFYMTQIVVCYLMALVLFIINMEFQWIDLITGETSVYGNILGWMFFITFIMLIGQAVYKIRTLHKTY